jgi:hypothetical protein
VDLNRRKRPLAFPLWLFPLWLAESVLLIYAGWKEFSTMRTIKRFLCLLTVVFGLLASSGARAEKPINLALFAPLQVFDESETISGFRFNLIYGRQARMSGFDLGLVNHVKSEFLGVQWGFVNIVEGNSLGWQAGFVNYNKGQFLGAQTGVVNYAGTMSGLQFGFVNWAGTMKRGLQIGLANIIEHDGWLPFMVIANGKF